MDVLVDGWGYLILLDSPNGELKALIKTTLEAEVFSVIDEDPFNIPTGKKLTLRVDPYEKDISYQYLPPNSDWNGLQRIDVKISLNNYRNIYYGTGRVRGSPPELSTNILIQDINAV